MAAGGVTVAVTKSGFPGTCPAFRHAADVHQHAGFLAAGDMVSAGVLLPSLPVIITSTSRPRMDFLAFVIMPQSDGISPHPSR